MGCASSKRKRCKHCQAPYPPVTRRSFSMNVHHPPVSKGDTYHVVALTSSTLGSIKLDPPTNQNFGETKWVDEKRMNYDVGNDKKGEFELDMIEAKAWSKMIDEKIPKVCPKTPIQTPPCEPETIDVKDLMKGLEDSSPLRTKQHLRSFSFHVSTDSLPLLESPRTMPKDDELESEKQTCVDAPGKVSNASNRDLVSEDNESDLDPEVVSSFRKTFEELSPTNPFYLKAQYKDQLLQGIENGVLEAKDVIEIMAFERKSNGGIGDDLREENKIDGDEAKEELVDGVVASYGFVEKEDNCIVPENGFAHSNGYVEKEATKEKEKVTLYFTSLRGVRKTYEDCCYVKLILKGFRVRVDERDVSMHSGFKEELKDLLGEGYKGGLPKVFVGKRHIGGADELRQMHEDGKLEKVLQCCEMLEDDKGNLVNTCEACGDIRFVPCETCSGSCKIYYECEHDDEEFEEDEYGFQRCPDCNENGLVRCPICCH